MRLSYDHYTGRYLGHRYSVDEWIFLEALQALILGGCEPEEALDRVLDEAAWSPNTAGVLPLPSNPTCRGCGTPLPWPRQSFCDVICEAATCADHVGRLT
jgi:hypothetical protein